MEDHQVADLDTPHPESHYNEGQASDDVEPACLFFIQNFEACSPQGVTTFKGSLEEMLFAPSMRVGK